MLLVLLVMGTTSTISLCKEFGALDLTVLAESLSLGQEERIRRGLATCERRLDAPQGREYTLYVALRDHSEPRSQVFILCPDAHQALSVQAHMRVLLHPRTMWLLDRLPADWALKATALGAPVYLVDYGNAEPLPLSERCDLVLADQGVRVWRFRREQHR